MLVRGIGSIFVLGIAVALTACGNSDNSKVEKVINDQFVKDASCTNVPVGQPVDLAKVGADGALGLLKSKGYIVDAKATVTGIFGRRSVIDTYAMTDKAKPLVQREGVSRNVIGMSIGSGPCLRTGHFVVDKVEAIDIGNDVEGKPIASVRARIKFIPEEWLADTRQSPAWTAFWKNITDIEAGPWLYQLLKSGSDYYAHGAGRKLQR